MPLLGSSGSAARIRDDTLKRSLRIRAAEHGRSMEEEARGILRQAVCRRAAPENLGEAIHRRFAALGGVDVELPPHERLPKLPQVD
jgi:antitoxin FitA